MGDKPAERPWVEEVARLGAGVNPLEMNAERIDGMNPLADRAYRHKRKVIEDRKGPVLLDVVTYRISGHSPSDSSSYRTKEEIAMWKRSTPSRCSDSRWSKPALQRKKRAKEIELGIRKDMVWAVKLGKDETIAQNRS